MPLGPQGGDYTSVLVENGASAPALIAGAWDTARRRCGADFIHLPYVRDTLHLHTLVMQERRVLFTEPITRLPLRCAARAVGNNTAERLARCSANGPVLS